MKAPRTQHDPAFEIQAQQYGFPYHYLVDLERQEFGRHLDWGLDYLSYMTKVLELARRHLDARILDIGCGDGFLLNHLMRLPEVEGDARAVGLDVDEKPILFARAFAHGVPNLAFHACDIAAFDEPFPLVTLVETLEHIPDEGLPRFLHHVDRLLEPGGTLIVSVPSTLRPVIDKHHRHYDVDALLAHFPYYAVREVYHISARRSLLYQLIALVLSDRPLNLNVAPVRRLLLALHRRFTYEVAPGRGAHIVAVLAKA